MVKDSSKFLDMGHNERRTGDTTKGEYFVLLPDGRFQTVTYYVDPNSGYVAQVKYSDETQSDFMPVKFPDEPIYKPTEKNINQL